MWFRKIKILLYIGIAIGSLFYVQKYFAEDTLLTTNSLVSLLNSSAVQTKFEPPDLGISNVSLKKIADPKDNFNFYRYKANVVINNFGGDVKNAQVVLSGEGQRYVFIKNNSDGFSLEKDKSYILENYEIIFDANYNGGKIPLRLEINGADDYYLENNKYEVEIFELPVRIDSIGLEEILEDGSFILKFEPKSLNINAGKFEIYVNDGLTGENLEEKYAEIFILDKIYSYFRVKNSLEIIKARGWKSHKVSEADSHSIKFSENPFKDDRVRYLFIKMVDKDNDYYAVSNILKFVPQKELDRAEFAKLFVDYAEIKPFVSGENYFEDVKQDSWYGPYVQTLYNLGLIKNDNSKYFPESPITREEVLRIVLDYFDVDLAFSNGGLTIRDVEETDEAYSYVEVLHNDGNAGIFGDYFRPKQSANKHFLKYLINEYKKDT